MEYIHSNAGAIRFNTDSSQMEIYDGNQWTGIVATSPELQTGGTRGLFHGGLMELIELIQLLEYVETPQVNATDFGDLTQMQYFMVVQLLQRTQDFIHGGERPAMNILIDLIQWMHLYR